jgi:hypothetical protein
MRRTSKLSHAKGACPYCGVLLCLGQELRRQELHQHQQPYGNQATIVNTAGGDGKIKPTNCLKNQDVDSNVPAFGEAARVLTMKFRPAAAPRGAQERSAYRGSTSRGAMDSPMP